MRITILAALALLAAGGNAYAYDCRKPSTPIEAVVCSDPALVKLVDERRHAYSAAHDRIAKKDRPALYHDHWKWLSAYPGRCGVARKGKAPHPVKPEMVACLKREMEARVVYLRDYPKSASAEAKPAQTKPPAPEKSEAKAAPPGKPEKATPPAATAEKTAPPPAAPPEKTEAKPPPAVPPKESEKKPPAVPPKPAAAEAAPAAPAAHGTPTAAAPKESEKAAVAAAAPGKSAANPASVPASTDEAADQYHLKFTFACRTREKLVRVLRSLAQNDFSYPLSQSDCLPIPDGRAASLVALEGHFAKVRLCSADAGCVDVYADAASVLNAKGQPLGK